MNEYLIGKKHECDFNEKKHECDFIENWRAVDLFAVFFGLIFMAFCDVKNAFGRSDEN